MGVNSHNISFIDASGVRRLPQAPVKITARDEFGEPTASEEIPANVTVFEWDKKTGGYIELRGWLERELDYPVIVEERLAHSDVGLKTETRRVAYCRVEFFRDGYPVFMSTNAVPDNPLNRHFRKRIYVKLANEGKKQKVKNAKA